MSIDGVANHPPLLILSLVLVSSSVKVIKTASWASSCHLATKDRLPLSKEPRDVQNSTCAATAKAARETWSGPRALATGDLRPNNLGGETDAREHLSM